ncbi:MAG: hypothetical protein P4L69_13970 [Desulfosporosinus sp.]|nr:hypothetical protein [Desulfosporosinus sp.]
MKDERIQQAINKIRSEMTIIILVGVALSFLVKTLVFNMSLKECMTEYLIMILSPVYQFVRMHMMKISIYSGHGNKQSIKTMFIAISIFLVASAMSLFKKMKESTVNNWQIPVAFLFVFLVLFIAISLMTNKFNQQRRLKYEKEFDDDNL